jgi:hypothetical protein
LEVFELDSVLPFPSKIKFAFPLKDVAASKLQTPQNFKTRRSQTPQEEIGGKFSFGRTILKVNVTEATT